MTRHDDELNARLYGRQPSNQSAAAAALMGGAYSGPRSKSDDDLKKPIDFNILEPGAGIYVGGPGDEAKQKRYDEQFPSAPPADPAPPPQVTRPAPEPGSDEWYTANDKLFPGGWGASGGNTAGLSPTGGAARGAGAAGGSSAFYMPFQSGMNANLAMSQQNANNLNPLLAGDAMARIQAALQRLGGSGNYNVDSLIRQLGA